jgi:hypothetical protein
VKDRQLPPAGELIKIASQYGLETEIAYEVVKAVEQNLARSWFS